MRKKVSQSTGTYEVLYKSGKNYVGKGDYGRAIQSAIEHTKPNKLNNYLGDSVTSIRWKASLSVRNAFMEEYALQRVRGVRNSSTYNQIWSPDKKYYLSMRR